MFVVPDFVTFTQSISVLVKHSFNIFSFCAEHHTRYSIYYDPKNVLYFYNIGLLKPQKKTGKRSTENQKLKNRVIKHSTNKA